MKNKSLPGLELLSLVWTIWPLGVFWIQGEAQMDNVGTQMSRAQPSSDSTGDGRWKSISLS